jgi:hypothetical protein
MGSEFRVVMRDPGSWVDGREGTVLALNVTSPDGIRGHSLRVDGVGVTVVPPGQLERTGWACGRCGYMNAGPVCTKCGVVPPVRLIGEERRGYPSADRGTVNITVVLVGGENDDVCAYIGEGPPQWVAAHGDKLPLGECDAYFPGVEQQLAERGLTYRR